MKKKVFFASRTARMTIRITASSICMLGIVCAFYEMSGTRHYVQLLDSNTTFVKDKKVFNTEQDYGMSFANDATRASGIRKLLAIDKLANKYGLLTTVEGSSPKLDAFIQDVPDIAESSESVLLPEKDWNVIIKNASILIEKLVTYSEDHQKVEQLNERVDAISAAATIANLIDARGSYRSTMMRATSVISILTEVQSVLGSPIPRLAKIEGASTCMGSLNPKFSMDYVFKVEMLRAQTNLEVVKGAKIDRQSVLMAEAPKPLSPIAGAMRFVPGVQAAWTSRVYESMGRAIYDSGQMPSTAFFPINRLADNLKSDQSCTELIDQLGYDFMADNNTLTKMFVKMKKVDESLKSLREIPVPKLDVSQ